MEKYILSEDVKIFCVTAKSFPDGIIEAFQTLEKFHPAICERPFYGLTFEKKPGEILYKAAVEEIEAGEAKKYGCETFIIPIGIYLSETIFNFMHNVHSIPNAFGKLLSVPGVDKTFPSIEWYKSSKEVSCLVKLKLDTN